MENHRRNPQKNRLSGFRERTEKLREALELPADVVEGAIQVRISGNTEVIIGNHKKLLTYLDTCICLCGNRQKVTICGTRLCIPYYTEEAIRITGRIHSISVEPLYE